MYKAKKQERTQQIMWYILSRK